MATQGKQYYECPATTRPSMGGVAYLPLLADAVDSNGGVWTICDQDSDTEPTSFTVAVNDRRTPDLPRNPAVHEAIGRLPGARLLGNSFARARVAARSNPQIGPARADRMVDQIVGGE